jgi:RNA polymerase sigma-70 factor (ECF subfamily)
MNREELFRIALKENSQRIFRICSYYFTDPDILNDAYQESLIRIWENLGGFRGNAKLSTWIYRVVVNSCLSHIRADKRHNSLIQKGKDPAFLDIPEPEATEDQLDADKKTAFFRLFMEKLSAADRTLVSLYLEDFSTRDMAEVTGISEANVRVRIHRIKEKINSDWKEGEYGTR